MQLMIDDTEIQVDKSGTEIVAEILGDLQERGRFVKSVSFNGAEILLSSLPELLNRSQNPLEIRMVSCTLDELIEDVMCSANQYVPTLIEALHYSVSLFLQGNDSEGFRIVEMTLSGLQWNMSVLSNFAAMSPDQDALVCQVYHEGNSVFQALYAGVEDHDPVAIKDVMQFEIIPWLTRWLEFVDLFQSQIRLEHVKAGIHSNAKRSG